MQVASQVLIALTEVSQMSGAKLKLHLPAGACYQLVSIISVSKMGESDTQRGELACPVGRHSSPRGRATHRGLLNQLSQPRTAGAGVVGRPSCSVPHGSSRRLLKEQGWSSAGSVWVTEGSC